MHYLPGYLLLNKIKLINSPLNNFILSIATSFVITILSASILAFTKNLSQINLSIILVIFCIFTYSKNKIRFQLNRETVNVILVATLIFAVTSSPHLMYFGKYRDSTWTLQHSNFESYMYPLHVDEWTHLALAQYTADKGGLDMVNPYLGETVGRLLTGFLEFGYTSYLAALIQVLGGNPVNWMSYLPALNTVYTALLLFVLVQKLGMEKPVAYVSMLTYALIPSNVNVLGNWFFTAHTFATPHIILMLIFLVEMRQNPQIFFPAILSFLAAASLHGTYALNALLFTSTYLLLFEKKSFLKIFERNAKPLVGIIFFSFTFFFTLKINPIHLFEFLKNSLIYTSSQTQNHIIYRIYDLATPLTLFFALVGVVVSWKHKGFKPLQIWLIWGLLMWMIYNFYEFAVILRYQRQIYSTLIVLSIYSAYGLVKLSQVLTAKYKKNIFYHILILLLVTTSLYPLGDDSTILYHCVGEPEIEAMNFLMERQMSAKILCNPFMSVAVYPIAGYQTTYVTASKLGGGKPGILERFKNFDCTNKALSLIEHEIDYVVLRQNIDCPQFERIFQSGALTVYELKK